MFLKEAIISSPTQNKSLKEIADVVELDQTSVSKEIIRIGAKGN